MPCVAILTLQKQTQEVRPGQLVSSRLLNGRGLAPEGEASKLGHDCLSLLTSVPQRPTQKKTAVWSSSLSP